MFDIEALLLARGLGKRAENALRDLLRTEAAERRAADEELLEKLTSPDGIDVATISEVEAMLSEVFSN